MSLMSYVKAVAGALALSVASFGAQAASVSQFGNSQPGDLVLVELDVSTPNLAFFDLVLTAPTGMTFTGVIDDALWSTVLTPQTGLTFPASDGNAALYTPAASFSQNLSGQYLIDTFVAGSALGGVNYAPSTGMQGFRVNGVSGQFENFMLRFGTSTLPGPGTYDLEMFLTLGLDDGIMQSTTTETINFSVSVVPLPATGLLVLTGLGAMAMVARRRKTKAA